MPYRNSDVRTTCGCPVDANTLQQTEWTGMPTNVALLQVSLQSFSFPSYLLVGSSDVSIPGALAVCFDCLVVT